ncbi:hypothetical protein [Serratia liquefaciens]|uniref:hypothetical protein n=1 Tax=Serratia liquefaciens TaxID=614 RepID=UPI0021C9E382|nr:hypothetical protein [Serratia liquefaciens]
MKVKSIGFSIENKNKNISNDDIFKNIIACSNINIERTDYVRKIMVVDDNKYYTGLVLTLKNQKKNPKSTMKDGKFEVKVEDLQGDEKLVAFNFFSLKKSTLKGLYLYYFGSCSLNSLFSNLQTTTNNHIRNLAREEILLLGKNPPVKEVAKINEKYNDRVDFGVIIDKTNLEAMIASYKTIKSATFRFDSIDFKQTELKGVEQYARNTDLIFNIETVDRTKTVPIARQVKDIIKSVPGITKGKVVVTDYENNERIIDFFNCPTFFDEFDFDEMANKVDGLTNDNFHANEIIKLIKDQIENGKHKSEFN